MGTDKKFKIIHSVMAKVTRKGERPIIVWKLESKSGRICKIKDAWKQEPTPTGFGKLHMFTDDGKLFFRILIPIELIDKYEGLSIYEVTFISPSVMKVKHRSSLNLKL